MNNRDYIIETASGGFLNYDDPDPYDITIEDIARGLTFQPRFMGQTRFFYSVAQHSLLVSKIVADLGGHVGQVEAGLLHDAHEAYIGDCPTPLKRLYGRSYEDVREALDEAIIAALDLQPGVFVDPYVKRADGIALRAEAEALKTTGGRDSRWDRAWLPDIERSNWRRYVADVEMANAFTFVENTFLSEYARMRAVSSR